MEDKNTRLHPSELTSIKLKDSGTSRWEVRFLWLLVLVLLGYWGYGQVRDRLDPTVHRKALQLLRQRYPKHIVSVQSAHVIEGKAIVLDGIRIALPTKEGGRDLVRIGRVTAFGDLCLANLVKNDLKINEVKIDDLTVTAWPIDDQNWSIQTLADSGPLPASLPPLTINSGMLRLLCDAEGSEELICHDLKARCRLNQADANLMRTPYEVQAKFRSNAFDLVTVYLNISQNKLEWNASGEVVNLRHSAEITKKLPASVQTSLNQVAGFSGQVNSTFELQKRPNAGLEFEVNGTIANGSLIHPRLPYPLERLAGQIYCRNEILQLRNANAVSGDAAFQMNADVYGAGAETPIVLELQIQNLPIDQRLYQVLTPKLKDVWNRLQPDGIASGKIRMMYDGAKWRPEIEADIRDGKIQFASFPFPVSDVSGHISCSDRYVRTSNMRGKAAGAETFLVLLMQKQANFWGYDVSLSTRDPLPISEDLIDSLTPRGSVTTEREKFVRSLNPTGRVQVKQARFARPSLHSEPIHSLDLEVTEGKVAYDKFPYPVFGIFGGIRIENSQIIVQSLRGHNDSGTIRCTGATNCSDSSMQSLHLAFDCETVPLEEELRLSLPEGTRQLWDALQPSGVLDHVTIELNQSHFEAPLDIAVTIEEKLKTAPNLRTVSIRPREIPYPLTDIRCLISYRNGIANVEHISGVHDVSKLAATGRFAVATDGTWTGVMQWQPESRLIVDQSLLSCLPGYLQQPILSTAFRGPVSVMGETRFASSKDGQSMVMRECNLELAIEEGRLGWGEIASGIRGSVHVVGSYDDVNVDAVGELNLDSLAIYKVPVLNLKGPFALRNGLIYLGRDSQSIIQQKLGSNAKSIFRLASQQTELPSEATTSIPTADLLNIPSRTDPNFLRPADDPKLGLDPNDIVANCFGGVLYLRGVHEIATERSRLGLQLSEGDLAETLMDLGRPAVGVKGKLWAECTLQGVLHNHQTLIGFGQAWLRRADLIQMPVMSKMFRILSIKDPKSGAFESGEVSFKIDGDKIPLEKISLDGDIISLRGNGTVNMRHEVDLDLLAYVGKRSVVAAVLGPIVSHNDNASLMAVKVDGTLEALNVTRGLKLLNANAKDLFRNETGDVE